jgi:zinc-finger of a C2HC-type
LKIYENAADDGENEDDRMAGVDDERIECPSCGRKFVEEALARHQKVCKKVFVQKRKVFDTKKIR